MNGLLAELNRIARQEIGEIPKYECCFCGWIRKDAKSMTSHIIKHLKEVLPVCSDCGMQHIPDAWDDREEILEAHAVQFINRW